MKLSLGITPDGETRATTLTPNSVSDVDTAIDILGQETADIEVFVSDGGHDKRKVYDLCQKEQIGRIIVPPQKNAKIWQHSNCKGPPHPRDENLCQIRKSSRNKWKGNSDYHVRSFISRNCHVSLQN